MKQAGYLSLRLQPDDDGTAELFVSVSANGFAGRSSAWFGIDELQHFAARLAAYPLDLTTPLAIAGGFWDQAHQGVLEQIHVNLRVSFVSPRGQVGVHISLSTPIRDSAHPDPHSTIATELLTSYQAIARFSASLMALTKGSVAEAVLPEDVLG